MRGMTSTTADKILECAHALLLASGYDGLRYADIAERVGISKPSIRYRFPTKAQLVLQVVRGYRRQVQSLLEQARAMEDPLRQVTAYVGYWAICVEESEVSFCVCAMLALKPGVLPGEIGAEVNAHFKTLAAWLEEVLAQGAASGQFKLRHPVALEAQCFLAQIHASMLTARALADRRAFALVGRACIARLCGGPEQPSFR